MGKRAKHVSQNTKTRPKTETEQDLAKKKSIESKHQKSKASN